MTQHMYEQRLLKDNGLKNASSKAILDEILGM